MNATQPKRWAVPVSAGRARVIPKQCHELKLRRILVPLDFSGESRQALECAVPLAAQYGAKISLMHVVEAPTALAPYPGQVGFGFTDLRALHRSAHNQLAILSRKLLSRKLIGNNLVRIGRAYVEIIRVAHELQTDLIVIATHGYTGLKHVLLGSTAEHVVREAPCPVLTVHRNSHEIANPRSPKTEPRANRSRQPGALPRLPGWRRVLVPTDLSNASLRALEVAIPLAGDLGAQLFLLSAVEPVVYAGTLDSVVPPIPEATLLEQAKASLRHIAKRLIPSDLKLKVLVDRGRASEVITRVAQEQRADLIVLTTYGHTGIEHLMLGSTAERVVRQARCPVYVVRAFPSPAKRQS